MFEHVLIHLFERIPFCLLTNVCCYNQIRTRQSQCCTSSIVENPIMDKAFNHHYQYSPVHPAGFFLQRIFLQQTAHLPGDDALMSFPRQLLCV